jgi:uncharacterized protein involved in exopolysaccharide biosynthesis
MTLDELRKIENEASVLESKATRAKASHELFARLRKEGKPLYVELTQGASLRYSDDSHSFLQGVLNELGPEILRLAEMRKEAFERECRIKARALRLSINDFLSSTEAA